MNCIANRTTTSLASFSVLILFVILGTAEPAHAQRASGDVGLGIEIGEPSGVSLHLYRAPGPSWDFLAAWDVDDFFFLNGHAVYERGLGQQDDLHLFYGPGAFVGVRDRGPDDDDVVVGASATIGLGFLIDRFEIYVRVTPRLSVVPDTNGDVGAGVGARYFF